MVLKCKVFYFIVVSFFWKIQLVVSSNHFIIRLTSRNT